MITNESEENTVKYYDIVYGDWINEKYTNWEINFITKQIPSKGKILDIGCGSGRHIIPLYNLGYEVLGIEPLKSFICQIMDKNSKVSIINSRLDDAIINEKYDMIISMWNTLHQLAYTYDDAKELLVRLKGLLKKDGKILFSFTPAEIFDIKNYTFSHEVRHDNKLYHLDWTTKSYNEVDNIVLSEENIKIYDTNGVLKDNAIAEIRQKFWSEFEIKSLCKELGLKFYRYPPQRGEHDSYYVLSVK